MLKVVFLVVLFLVLIDLYNLMGRVEIAKYFKVFISCVLLQQVTLCKIVLDATNSDVYF